MKQTIQPITEQVYENSTIEAYVRDSFNSSLREINDSLTDCSALPIDKAFIDLLIKYLRQEGDPSGVFLHELDHLTTVAKEGLALATAHDHAFEIEEPEQLSTIVIAGLTHDIVYHSSRIPLAHISKEEVFDYENLVLKRMAYKSTHCKESADILRRNFSDLLNPKDLALAYTLINSHGRRSPEDQKITDVLRIADRLAHYECTLYGNKRLSRVLNNVLVNTQDAALLMHDGKTDEAQKKVAAVYEIVQKIMGKTAYDRQTDCIDPIAQAKGVDLSIAGYKAIREYILDAELPYADQSPLSEIGKTRAMLVTKGLQEFFESYDKHDFHKLQEMNT